MGTTKLGGDEPLPEPATRKRQGTALGVAPSATIPRGDPFAPDAGVTTTATSHYTCATCGDVVLPEGTRFCGVCGGPVNLRAEVVASVSAPGNATPQVAISVTLQQPTVVPIPPPVPADHSKTGAATQTLPAAQPKRKKSQRTLLGELQTLRLIQGLEDKAELTNLGKAAGLILLLLVLGFISWAVYDGWSRRRPSVADSSGPSLNISIPLTDASTED